MKNSIALAVFVCCFINISFSNPIHANPVLADHVLNERLATLNAKVELRLTDLSRKKIEEYVGFKLGAERLITKSRIYFPVFEKELAKYNIPEEFKYLPIIESNLSVDIKSSAGAVGLWQFMKRTGQFFGLQIGAEVDERMDVEKSTQAAAQYLLQLYNEFQDWTLVLAAYNAGAGNIRKAIRKSGKRNYWDLYGYLPRETRSYLPKFTAAAYLINYHSDHGIQSISPDQGVVDAITAKVFHELDFKEIAKASGTPIETIEILNAQYIKGFIPESNDSYLLKLPANDMKLFLTKNPSIRVELSSIPSHLLKQVIKIPEIPKDNIIAIESTKNHELVISSEADTEYEIIKLGKKETLYAVAMRAGITLDKLLVINGLKDGASQDFNKYLKVPVSAD